MEDHVVREGRVIRALLVAVVACGSPPAHVEQASVVRHGYDVGAVHVEGAPPLDPAIGKALDRYGAIPSARLLDISATGTEILIARGGDAFVLTAPLAEPVAVAADVDVAWAAFGERGAIDVAGDRDGTEDDHLYEVRAGAVTPLVTDRRIADPIERHGRLVWAEPSAERTAIWMLDGTPRKVFEDDGMWAVIDLSSDGRQLLARQTRSRDSSTLYRIDAMDGHAVALTSVDPRVAAPVAQFGASGQLFAIASAGDRLNVWELMLRGQRLLAPELAWDVTQIAIAPDGSTVAFTANVDGASVLYLYDVQTHAHRLAERAPAGGVISELKFAAHAPVLAFSFSDPAHPRAPYTYDLAHDKLTAWLAPPVIDVPVIEPVHVAIGDIHALVMRPASEKSPVIVELHGGPEDQWQTKWAPFEQFLVSRGFAIVQPNVRGSVGYGRAFAAADDGALRGGVVDDVGAVLAWIATQPDLDPSRVFVMGTSYGGYLALASLIAFPDKFRAGVDIAGIADLVGFLEGTAAYRRAARRAEYGDERDPATRTVLDQLSPLARAHAIRVPLLVAHGQKDPRVPPPVADRLVRAVRGRVWYVTAANEGHGFSRPENLGVLQTLIVQLLSSP